MSFFRSGCAALAVALLASCGSAITQRQHANLAVSPLSVDFGSQIPGASSKQTLTISNNGTRAIAIISANVTSDARNAFKADALPDLVGAGASVAVNITYSAATEGSDAAALVIESDGDNSEVNVPLLGRTIAPCQAGQLECNGKCVDISQDSQNCGGCGRACSADQRCAGGSCQCAPRACPAGACGQVDDGCGGLSDCGGCAGQNECIGNLCIQPTCTDGRKNGNETGVDCGGPQCNGCGAGGGCSSGTDCGARLDCAGGTCGLDTPSALTVSQGGAGQLIVTWAGSPNADTFDIQRSPDGQNFTDVGSSSTSTFTDSSLLNGTQYTYRVRAISTLAQSGWSGTASGVTVLPAPTSLSVSGTTRARLTVSWTGVSNATGYNVFRSSDSGSTYTGVGNTADPTWTFADSGLSDGKVYFYEVQASRGGVLSAKSVAASNITAPAAPTGLAATLSGAQVNLVWNAPAGAASYTVYRSNTSGGPYSLIANNVNAASATDTTALAGGTYFYVVTATDAGGTSGYSNEAATTRAPGAPTGLAASVTGQSVQLTWTKPLGATSYTIARSATSGGAYLSVGTSQSESFTDTAPDAGVAFFYVVSATNSGGTSDFSSEVRAVTNLPAPTGLTVVSIGTGQLKLTWTGAAHSDSYLVQRSTDGVNFSDLATVTAQTDTDQNLDNAATYTYRVRANNSLTQSVFSPPVSATTLLPVPQNLTVAGSQPRQLVVTWSPVANATGYNVFRSDDGGSTYAAVGATVDPTIALTDTGLQDGKTYFYEVQASRGGVVSVRSSPASNITAPASPTGLTALASTASVALSWNATPGAQTYSAYRSTTAGGPYTLLSTVGTNAATDSAPIRGSTYFYVVTATNAGGSSANSSEASATLVPTAPTNPVATGGTTISLSWSAPSGATGYLVRRAGTSGGPYTTIGTPSLPGYSDASGLSPGVRYYYVVDATNAGGTGPDSVEVSAVTTLDAPAGLAATPGTQQIALAWNPVTGANGYFVLRSDDGGNTFTQIATVAGTSYTDVPLANGSRHGYAVRARSNDAVGPSSASVFATTVLPAPAQLTATGGSKSIALSWSAVGDATGYRIYRSQNHGVGYTLIATATSTSAADSGLADGVLEFYVVTSTTADAESANSPEAQASTTLPAVQNLTATGGQNQVQLTWSPVAAATVYNVWRDGPGPRTLIASVSAPASGTTDTGLKNGTNYTYEVIAADAATQAAPSLTASAATFMPAPQPAATGGVKQIALNWPAVADATGYQIFRTATSGSGYSILGTATSAAYTDTGLADGATWFYEVKAVGNDVISASSGEVSATTRKPNPLGGNSTFTVSPSSTTADGASLITLTLTVHDGDNLPVSGTPVTFTSDGSGNTLTAPASTDVNGKAVATLASTVAEGKNLTASAGSFFTLTGSASFTAGTATKLVFSRQPSNIGAGQVMSPAVQVSAVDAQNNVNTNFASQITLTVAGQTVSGNSATAAAGVATFPSVSMTAAGNFALTATAGSLTGTSSAFTVSPAGLAKLIFIAQPSNATAGQAISPAVTVAEHDAFDNLLTTATDTITVSAAGATLTQASAVASGGLASFSQLASQTAGTFTLTARTGAVSSSPSASFTISADAPNQLSFLQQPTNVMAGVAMTPAVQVAVLDRFGNLTGYGGAVSLSLGFSNSVNASSGVATFPAFNMHSAGIFQITATANGINSPSSSAFTVSPAALTKVVFVTQPSNGTAGVALSPAVAVELHDSFDNKVNSSAQVTLTAAGAVLDSAVVNAVAGSATFGQLASETAGTFTLVAQASGISSSPSSSFTIVAAGAQSLVITQQPSNGVAGQPISPAVQLALRDQFGNTANSSAQVTLTVPGASATGTSVLAVAGVATFSSFTVSTPGTFALSGASGALTSASSNSFTIIDVAPANLAYTLNPAVYTKGQAIAPNNPSSSGGKVISYSVAPALPNGLSIDGSSGIITGAPTALQGPANYVVTAINSGGSAQVTLSITVNDVKPSALSYTLNPAVYVKNQSIAANTPSAAGGPILAWSITPALPAGLLFDASTGIITGTPSAVSPAASYTVTASNSGGSAQVTLNLSVNDLPPANLTYQTNPATYTINAAISANTPSSTGGSVVSYSVSPPLPGGLSINAISGAINGTPTTLQAAANYVVTATNSGGSTTATLSIAVVDVPPSSLQYSTNPAVFTRNQLITNDVPTASGGPVTSWSINPPLPAGLVFNTSTGVVSGTPGALQTSQGYVVTAKNSGGTTTVVLNITVNDQKPTSLIYSANPATYTLGVAITPDTPTSGGGAVTGYSVSPGLPAGLAIDASSGIISGTPLAITPSANYTVTASNSGGSTTATVNITVNDAKPTNLSYSPNPATYTKGQVISNNSPSYNGGQATSFSISPSLSGIGLNFDTGTGIISGTPSTISTASNYTVTATNSGGSTSVVLSIAIVDVPPSGLTYSTNPATYTRGTTISTNFPSLSGGGPATGYTVSPSLPAGLTLDAVLGRITGTPSAIAATSNYTVTASNSGGSTTATLTITVKDIIPSGITYPTNPATYTLGVTITNDVPGASGGPVTSWSVSPALPAGLAFSTANGTVSGRPTALAPQANYTVTATNSGGSATATLVLTVVDVPPSSLTYSANPATFTNGVAITNDVPSVGGGAVTSWSISPALPSGLAFNTGTGVISGTPLAITPSANYTVTAANSGGFTTATLNITVNDQKPTSLTYSPNPATYTKGQIITNSSPSYNGGQAVSFSISPSLASIGLSFDTSTGVISGTPSTLSSASNYTITATNSGGSTTVVLSIAIVDVPPSGLTYSTNPAVYTKGTAIGTNFPSLSGGGTVTGYSVSPSLPAGLTLDPVLGRITGTPSAVTATANYVVTASNTGGSTTATLTITVNDVTPSNIVYPANPATFTKGVAITNDVPSASGGAITSWSVNPSLPAGLSFSAANGTVSGTPTVLATQANYTVTATNSGGSANVTLVITVNDVAPSGLTYSVNPATFTNGVTIANDTPSLAGGGAITSWSVSPALPTGLTFNTTNGIVSGTPTVSQAQASYTVTATNSGGSTSTTLKITVQDPAPSNLTYSTNPATYVRTVAIATNTPSYSGTVTGWSVSPALPSGLTLNASTGNITGTPTAVTAQATYTVTASNGTGSTTVGLVITVNDIAVATVTYGTAVVAPNANASTDGNSNDAIPFTDPGHAIRQQVVYDKSQFSVSGAQPITELRWRSDYSSATGSGSAGARTSSYTSVTVVASTTARTGTTLSSTFASNTGADAKTIYSGSYTWTSSGTAQPNGTKLFDIVLTPTSQFSYNPASGNLLLDITVSSFGGQLFGFDTTDTGTTNQSVVQIDSGSSFLYTQAPIAQVTFGTGATSALDCVQGAFCSTSPPLTTGGAVSTWSTVPTLPNGLAIDPTTGIISGTPTATASASNYTVTAANPTGSATATVSLTVNGQVPEYPLYTFSSYTFTRNTAISSLVPSLYKGTATSWSISPSLPAGLSFSTATGTISGTPTAASAATNYSVVASNGFGSSLALTLSITVNDIAPTSLAYSPASLTCTQGFACASATPTNSGGTITSYTISPSLPAGLAISSTTGVISGTPTVTSSSATYTVTGSNAVNSTTALITVAVNAAQTPAWGEKWGDAQRSSRTTASGPLRADPRWSASADATQFGTTCPLVGADGTLYVVVAYTSGYTPGAIAALNPATGAQKWLFKESGKSYGCPSLGPNGNLYVHVANGTDEQLESINSSGVLQWALTLSSGTFIAYGMVAIDSAGKIDVTSPTGKSWQVVDSGSSGSVKWTFPSSGVTQHQDYQALSVDGATLYVGTGSGNSGQDTLYAIRTSDGVQLAQYGPFSDQQNWTSLAVAPSGMLYAESVDPGWSINDSAFGFPAVTATNNSWTPTWTQTIHGWYWQHGAIATDGTFYVTRLISSTPYLWKISSAGAIVYNPSMSGSSFNQIALDASGLLMALQGTTVEQINPAGASPTVSWSTTVAANANAMAVGSDGTVFVTTDGSLVYAFQRSAAPTAISYSPASLTCTRNSFCTSNAPSTSGGTVAAYTSTSLPAGLSINSATGVISGTPSVIASSASYTVTGSNSGGSASTSFTIVVNDIIPSGISYASTLTCTKNSACTSVTPSSSGGPVVTWAASGLPAGLSINSGTGVVSGTPSAISSSASYTVTATNTGGTASGSITIVVNDIAPAFSYSSGLTCTKGSLCTSVAPTSTGGTVVTWSASGLPSGLTIASGSGVISGTPTAIGSGSYTVSATNSGGTTNGSITITVNDAAPTALTYTPSSLSCTQNVACSLGPPTNGGGTPTLYAISGCTVPSGMSIAPSTGTISGTPTAVGTTPCTITASNTGGSTTTNVTITVSAALSASIGDLAVDIQDTVTGFSKNIYKLKASSGAAIWGPIANENDGQVGVDPLDFGVYTGAGPHVTGGTSTIYKLNASNGSQAWSQTFTQSNRNVCGAYYGCNGGFAVDTTSATPGVVCTESGCDGYMVKFNRTNGAFLWGNGTYDLTGPAIDTSNGTAYAISNGSAHYDVIDSSSASGGFTEATWSPDFGTRPEINPADNSMYYGSGTTLYSLNKPLSSGGTETSVWSLSLSTSLTGISSIAVQPYSGGYIYVADSASTKIVVVDPVAKSVVRTFNAAVQGSSIAVNPSGGNLYVSNSSSHFVYCYAVDGTPIWASADLGGNVSSIAAVRNTLGSSVNNLATFTASGALSWTAPSGVTSVNVTLVGGGGGGGGSNSEAGAGGGGSGQLVHSTSFTVTAGNTYTGTIGAGGGAGVGGSGGSGGNSTFSTLTALGGLGGAGKPYNTLNEAGAAGGGGANGSASCPGGSSGAGSGGAGAAGTAASDASCAGGGQGGGSNQSSLGQGGNGGNGAGGNGGGGASGQVYGYAGGGGGGAVWTGTGGAGGYDSYGVRTAPKAGSGYGAGGGGDGGDGTGSETGSAGAGGLVVVTW